MPKAGIATHVSWHASMLVKIVCAFHQFHPLHRTLKLFSGSHESKAFAEVFCCTPRKKSSLLLIISDPQRRKLQNLPFKNAVLKFIIFQSSCLWYLYKRFNKSQITSKGAHWQLSSHQRSQLAAVVDGVLTGLCQALAVSASGANIGGAEQWRLFNFASNIS